MLYGAYPLGREDGQEIDEFQEVQSADCERDAGDRDYFLNIPDPDGPYGAKEGSLGFGLGLHGAIAIAVHDACGVWVYDMPITPDKLLKALEEKEKKGLNPQQAARILPENAVLICLVRSHLSHTCYCVAGKG